MPTSFTGYTRVVCIFDGHDPAAVEGARTQWKAAVAQGAAGTYGSRPKPAAGRKKLKAVNSCNRGVAERVVHERAL